RRGLENSFTECRANHEVCHERRISAALMVRTDDSNFCGTGESKVRHLHFRARGTWPPLLVSAKYPPPPGAWQLRSLPFQSGSSPACRSVRMPPFHHQPEAMRRVPFQSDGFSSVVPKNPTHSRTSDTPFPQDARRKDRL